MIFSASSETASGGPVDRRACPKRLWHIRLDCTAPTSAQWNAGNAILPCSTSSPWPPSWMQMPTRSWPVCGARPIGDLPSRKEPGAKLGCSSIDSRPGLDSPATSTGQECLLEMVCVRGLSNILSSIERSENQGFSPHHQAGMAVARKRLNHRTVGRSLPPSSSLWLPLGKGSVGLFIALLCELLTGRKIAVPAVLFTPRTAQH